MKSTPEMDAYAVRAIDKALLQGNFLFIGDNPNGIDWAILNHLMTKDVPRMQYTICTAAQERPRSVARLNKQPFNSLKRFEDYVNRDRCMVEFADVTMCIWDGSSKGTKGTYDYACDIGRLAYLIQIGYNNKVTMERSIKNP